jgi:hypothetical protein
MAGSCVDFCATAGAGFAAATFGADSKLNRSDGITAAASKDKSASTSIDAIMPLLIDV